MLQYRLLGTLEVVDGERGCTPSAPRLRTTLAMLLLRRGTPLTFPEILEELWGTCPPRTSTNSVQVFMLRLRRLLAPDLHASDPRQVLCTTGTGYALRVDAGQLDVCRFADLVADGGRALDAGDPERAARTLREALALWRGCPLADVPAGPLLHAHTLRLEEERLSALELRVEADLRMGRHRELVGELRALVDRFPLREAFHRQLMLALYRSGRQAEALDVYRRLRRVLVEELGVEPGAETRRLHHAILTEDPGLTPRPAVAISHLPADIADFTGRREAMAAIRAALTRTPLVVLGGPPGIGKSVTAVHVAHLSRTDFPDGCLYADLGDVGPREVLGRFLHDGPIPASLEERSALYRARLDDRRVLVILDDAVDEAQVRPLLPAGRGCAVLATSRQRLPGLAGAAVFELPVFTPGEAAELLSRLAGRPRIGADPRSACRIARLCGLLPLAVRAAGAKLAAKPHWTVAEFAARLANSRRRLSELRVGDLDVRSGFAAAYRSCDPLEQHVFRLLAANPAADFPAWVASAAAGADPTAVEVALEALVDKHLLQATGPDPLGQVRYRYHGLLRDYADERLDEEAPGERQTVLWSVMQAYANRTRCADPLPWLAAERAALLALIGHANRLAARHEPHRQR